MCDLATIFGILLGANICLIVSIATCGVAIGLNLGIFTAPAAPVVFAVALATGLAANIALLPVLGMLSGCTTGQCKSTAQDAMGLLMVVAGSLAAGIGIAYIAALTSAVPIVGTGPMVAYAVCLVMATVFLVQAIDKLRELQSCLAVPPPAAASAATATGIIALALTIVGFVIYGLFTLGSKRPDK